MQLLNENFNFQIRFLKHRPHFPIHFLISLRIERLFTVRDRPHLFDIMPVEEDVIAAGSLGTRSGIVAIAHR